MDKSGFNSEKIYKNDIKFLKGVSSLTVSNYSTVDLYITISNVKRTVPAFDPVLKVPYYFNIPGDGTFTDVDITFEYSAVKGSSECAILDYRQEKKC